jgi:hypothetical protein
MGLKRLISRLDSGQSFGNTYPNHNTPDNVGGFNYGESISIFDANQSNNDYFPFKQRSMGYGPQGIKDTTGMFGRLHGPAPYRKQNLPDLNPNKLGPGDTGPILGVGGAIDSVTDVGIRGGLVTALKRSVIDAARIGEFMLSAKGLGFIAKNVGLQMTNPKLQEGGGSSFLGMNLGSNNRIYNLGINTLAQTLTAASGLHVNRAGLLPIGAKNYEVEQGYRVDTNNKSKYEWNVRGVGPEEDGGTGNKTNGINVYKSNRLTALYNNLLNPYVIKELGESGTFGSEFSGADFDGNPMHAPDLYSFRGGPHSVYGIGKTRLKRYVFTNRDTNKAQIEIKQQRDGYKQSRHLGFRQGPKQQTTNQIIDFRKNRGIPYTNYDQKLGDLGQTLDGKYGYARGVVRPSIPTNKDGTVNIRASHPLVDKINSTDIWTHTGPWDTTELGSKTKDFIKFRIEAVNTDKPTESDTMVFRAFLDSMDDNYSAKWNEYTYNGRAEPFYTYGGFNRGISFSFKVAAFSRDDMRPMYRKLNYLVSQTAGEYNNTRLRGNFCRLTIGDYHSRLPGFFKSISLKWSKEYPWEIALNQGGVGSMADIAESNHTNSPQSQLTTGREQMILDMADDREVQKLMADQNGGDAVPITDFQGGQNPPTVNVNGGAGKQDMDSDMLELPHMLDVSCTFQPVHDFIPQKSVKKSPFILPTKYSKNGMTDQQDWLKWNAISQDKRQEDLDKIDEEEKTAAALATAREEEARQKEEEQRREENRKWLEADAERRGVNDPIEIEEEDDPDPWDLPPQDPDVDPNLLPPQGPPATGP